VSITSNIPYLGKTIDKGNTIKDYKNPLKLNILTSKTKKDKL